MACSTAVSGVVLYCLMCLVGLALICARPLDHPGREEFDEEIVVVDKEARRSGGLPAVREDERRSRQKRDAKDYENFDYDYYKGMKESKTTTLSPYFSAGTEYQQEVYRALFLVFNFLVCCSCFFLLIMARRGKKFCQTIPTYFNMCAYALTCKNTEYILWRRVFKTMKIDPPTYEEYQNITKALKAKEGGSRKPNK